MSLWITGASLLAILALAGIARLLSLGGPQQIGDDAAAIALAEALVSGFEGAVALRSSDGTRAMVASAAGELVILTPLGARHRADHHVGAQPLVPESYPENGPILLRVALASGQHVEMPVNDAGAATQFATHIG